MFEQYSDRARRIIFLARLKAGQDGAPTIDVPHLLSALVIEDQGGDFAEPLTGIPISQGHVTTTTSVTSRVDKPFFVSQTAHQLLPLFEKQSRHSKPIPATTDLPLTSAAEKVLESAQQLKERFRHHEVKPLHILAAALAENGGYKDLFQHAGITEEKVLAAIQKEKEKGTA